jgi:hypothetical protein
MTLKPQMNYGFAMSQICDYSCSNQQDGHHTIWFADQKTTTAYVPSSMIIPIVGNQDHTHQTICI